MPRHLLALLPVTVALCVACGESPPPEPERADRAPSAKAAPPAAKRPDRRPNLMLITLDTTRADALGAYGQQLPTSPTMDRLAREGVVFEQVSTTNPETLPAHSTILTGMWPYAHGVRANAGFVLSDRHTTLAEHLGERGYATSAEIAANVIGGRTQIAQGFDRHRDPTSDDVVVHTEGGDENRQTTRPGSDISAKGIQFIRANRKKEFFVWLHFFDPHNPYEAPRPYAQRVPESDYHAEIAYTDAQVGAVVDEIERLGLRDDTLVVITADHGEGLEEHGEPSHSYFVYETVMRVPLILWGPSDLPKGRRVAAPVRTVDVAPTALDLLGVPPLPAAQGRSLVPLITGAKTDLGLVGYGEATRFNATFGLPPLRFVRDGRWKYIHKVNPELYDVVADPGELVNRASEEPAVVERLRSELESMLRLAPPAPRDARAEIDAATARELMALGYVAQGPTLRSESESLELYGDDVAERAADVVAMSRVNTLIRLEEYQMVLDELGPVAERNPESTYVQSLLADAHGGLGDYEKAIALRTAIAEKEPEDVANRQGLAGQLIVAERLDEALAILAPLVEEVPCSEQIRLAQTHALGQQARHAEMLASLSDSWTQCPDLAAIANNYAWALATLPEDELRDGARALEVIRAVIEKSPEEDPAHLDTLAAALAETGDFAGAARTMKKVRARFRAAGAPPELLDQIRAHEAAYGAGRPWRETPTGS